MANSQYEVLEFRAVIKPEWTELYILCSAPSDGLLGVQGWHKKTIPPSEPALPSLQRALLDQSYLTDKAWSQSAP